MYVCRWIWFQGRIARIVFVAIANKSSWFCIHSSRDVNGFRPARRPDGMQMSVSGDVSHVCVWRHTSRLATVLMYTQRWQPTWRLVCRDTCVRVRLSCLSPNHATQCPTRLLAAGSETSPNPLMPTVAIWVQPIKHPVPDRVKPSFAIFDIRALWRSAVSVRVPGCQKLVTTA